MNKAFTAIFLLILPMTLTGCSLKLGAKTPIDNTKQNPLSKITDVLKLKIPQKCTYEAALGEGKTSGIIYMDGDKVHNIVTTEKDGTKSEMHYLMDGEWIYTWGAQIPGTKIKLADIEQMTPETTNIDESQAETLEGVKNVGVDANAALSCMPWLVDQNMFVAPLEINFMDVTAMLKGFSETFKNTTEKVDDLKSKACGACNMTPDEKTKAECLASLGCN